MVAWQVIGTVEYWRGDFEQAEAALQRAIRAAGGKPRNDILGGIHALLSMIAFQRGDLDLAHKKIIEALVQSLTSPYYATFSICLAVLARMLLELALEEAAIELYMIATRHPVAVKSRWLADLVGERLRNLISMRQPEALLAASQRAASRTPLEAVEECLARLQKSASIRQAFLA
jgi:tetratricopeptide (TPR) repeat protein